mgnify:CR=1 FL=1
MKLAICNDLFQGWPEEKIFRYVAELGYQGIEIAPFMYGKNVNEITEEIRAQIRQTASRYQLEIVGLHWVFLGQENISLTHPEPAVRTRTRDYLIALIKFCADIGGRVIVVGSPKQRNLKPEVSLAQGYQYAAQVFQESMDYAARRGVTVCIEPLGRDETNFITNMTEALTLVKMIAHPNFKTMFDVKAALTENRPLTEIINEGAAYIDHVHLNDRNGIAPGFGETDFTQIFTALQKIGYQRYLSVEVIKQQAGMEETATKSYNFLRPMLAGL